MKRNILKFCKTLLVAIFLAGSSVWASPLNLALLSSQYASWGVSPTNKTSSINLVDAWKNYKDKKEVVVAVIDTGIDLTHPFLKNNIYIPVGAVSKTNFGMDFSKKAEFKNQPQDNHGHGTHVSGIIKSVFPKVKILALKYYNQNATGIDNLNSTIEALKYAVEMKVDIINYSGGGPEPSTEEAKILKLAEAQGILVVAAAGNEESDIDIEKNSYYPASYGLSNIITVTAHAKDLSLLASSNYGKKAVDISAPGHRIKSALQNSRLGTLTGTSQATAFVTGVAALMLSQFPNLRPSEMKEIIKASAIKETTLAEKCSSGGRLDATEALKLAALKVTTPKRNIAERSNMPNTKVGVISYRTKAKKKKNRKKKN